MGQVFVGSYRDLLRKPKWQRKRLRILDRDQWTCQRCGATEHELQIHHRWYVRGKAPWDYPDEALITYCCLCHEEVSRMGVPQVVRHDTVADMYGAIPTAWTHDGELYLAQEPLEKVILEYLRHDPDAPRLRDTLWLDYLKFRGGTRFRQQTEEDMRTRVTHNHQSYMPPLQFEDDRGTKWLISLLALDFISKYYPPLHYKIVDYFNQHLKRQVQRPLTEIVPHDGNSLAERRRFDRIAQQCLTMIQALAEDTEEEFAIVHTRVTALEENTQGAFTAVYTRVDTLEQQVEELVRPYPGRMWMRTYIERILKKNPTNYDLKNWGYELTMELRNSGIDNPTIYKKLDPLQSRKVNTYRDEDLAPFLKRKGL